MLFDPARHEPLAGAPCDTARVLHARQAIVDDIKTHVDDAGHWPLHSDAAEPATDFKGLYGDSAGMR